MKKLLTTKNNTADVTVATATLAMPTLLRIKKPINTMHAKLKYTEGRKPEGINRSEIAMANKGIIIAKRLSLYIAPPNKANEPMAVKFGGCGIKRVIEAAIIIKVTTAKRGLISLFSIVQK